MRITAHTLTALVIALLTACAHTPEPTPSARMSVRSAKAPERRSQSDLPNVTSLEDLQAVTATPLDDDWEVRLGLSDGGELASGWHVLYCLLSYKGTGEAVLPAYEPWHGHLGPLKLRVDGPSGRELERANLKLRDVRKPTGATSLLFARIIATPTTGPYILTLSKSDDSLFRESRIDVQATGTMLWHTFADESADTQTVDGHEMQRRQLTRQPVAALPLLESNEPLVYLMSDGSQVIGSLGPSTREMTTQDAARGLPGMTPLSIQWHVEWFEGMDMRMKHLSDTLPATERGTWRLSLAENRLVIGDGVGFGGDASKLLARWWVNDKPIVAAELSEFEEGAAEVSNPRLTVGPIPLVLPTTLGDLNVGDKVSLQLLYCPDGFDLAGGLSLIVERLSELVRQSPVMYPQLTNRLDIEVTQQMLADREQAKSD